MPSLDTSALLPLALVFFATSVLSVITGSTSLITVPALLLFGIEPRVAVATNMLALVFMSAGGSVPFLRSGHIDRTNLPAIAGLTVVGSILGASLLSVLPAAFIPKFIGLAMVAVALFLSFGPQMSAKPSGAATSPNIHRAGLVFTFLLGIYGGLFSGGYVTLLTALFLAAFGHTMQQAIATTKVVNLLSSLVATALFAWKGLIQYELGVLLGLAALVGGLVGSKLVLRLPARVLRAIFLGTVWILAARAIFTNFL